MNCQACGADTVVTDNRPAGGYLRRRRKCTACGARFSTLEVPLDEARAALGARNAMRSSIMQASAELSETLERMRGLQKQLDGELDVKKLIGGSE